MVTYIIRRLIYLIPVLLGVLLFTFLLQTLIPTDVVSQMYAGTTTGEASAVAAARIREEFHLDKPWFIRLGYYINDILHGDLGVSVRTRRPVIEEVRFRYINTMKLTLGSLLVAITVGVGTGILSAYYKDTSIDFIAMSLGMIGLSLPAFFFGLVLIRIFAVNLRWVPVLGFGDWRDLILPSLCLGLIQATSLSRVTRSSMLDVLNQDYVRTARAKGLVEQMVIFRHALSNALLPVITIIGLQIGYLLGGTFIIEIIFGWHGIGELAVKSIIWRDFTITQGIILISAATYVLVNLFVDILYTYLDPRVSYTSD